MHDGLAALTVGEYLRSGHFLEATDLAEIGSFDAEIIDEAKGLVLALRERSAVRARRRGGESTVFLQQRNELTALLLQRILRVRAAARYVFRRHDDIVKQVTSAYQRRRRAAAHRPRDRQHAIHHAGHLAGDRARAHCVTDPTESAQLTSSGALLVRHRT